MQLNSLVWNVKAVSTKHVIWRLTNVLYETTQLQKESRVCTYQLRQLDVEDRKFLAKYISLNSIIIIDN